MKKWIVTLEITLEAENRKDAIDKADVLVYNLPYAMIYDAVEEKDIINESKN